MAHDAEQDPVVYVGAQALESAAKHLVRPEIVLFATHGFALPSIAAGQPLKPAGQSGDLRYTISGSVRDNPLLRCGLLFAGCNAEDAGHAYPSDDGILAGLEVLDIDLRGVELVVLSACQTGLGYVYDGDGVVGLRQAFQLAGARRGVHPVEHSGRSEAHQSLFREYGPEPDSRPGLARRWSLILGVILHGGRR